MNLPLQGRVALVTGAGRRLGRAVALRLAEEGGDVVVHYRSSQPEAQETVRQIEKLGRRATAVGADLDRKSTRLNSSHGYISYAVFCLKKKKHTAGRPLGPLWPADL